MRRTLFSALATTIVALLIPAGSFAQISFIPGPARSVANGPSFVATGDFNGDGIDDAVVSSTVRPRVTVLFGSITGEFSSAVELPVGQLLRGDITGDFNGDKINDIAVTDVTGGRVFVIFGKGLDGKNDGTFGGPQSFAAAPRGPVAITTGNFDNKPGLDAATANGNNNSFTVFSNAGGNNGLRSLGNFPTGLNPRAILSHDFNGDGVDDIVVLDTGTRGTDELSLYLNTGTGTFQSVVPERYVVGVGAKAMTLGDFNNDGKMDIAVLNTGGVGLNSFTISILLGNVSPRFNVLQPIVLSCPAKLNGIPVTCTPQDIKAADFDADTLTDLAVSFSTTATGAGQTTSGFVNAYAGRGDGSFDFGAQVIVGLGPRGIVAADVTGDAVPDIVVTLFTANAVQVLRAQKPPPKKLGDACLAGSQCASSFCADGVCCSTLSCPSGQRCDVVSSPGICAPPGQNGDPCTLPAECQSLSCVGVVPPNTDGFCCSTLSCPPGQFCNTGVCAPPAKDGTHCAAGEQCDSTFCTDGFCCTDARCAIDAACNIPGSEGSCFTRLLPGTACTDFRQCCSSATDPTACDPSFCLDGFCCETQCLPTESCGIPGFEGVCRPRPLSTPTPSRTPTPTLTPTPAPNGAPCATGSNCSSGNCVDGACCNMASCPINTSCNMDGNAGMCVPKAGDGISCGKATDCLSGFCSPSGVCAQPPTATPTPTATPVLPGDACGNTAQCTGGFFCNVDEGGVCCNLQICASDFSCRLPGHEGTCTRQSPTPTPKPGLGQSCGTGDQCDSGNCLNSVCCDTNTCDPPERCDIFGFAGSCGPPLNIGDPCTKNTDCDTGNGEQCRGGICQQPLGPSPTAIVPDPTPPPVRNDVVVQRSGGCAIDDSASDGRALLLLAGLPFALWLRRRDGAQPVRVRR